MLIIRKEKSFLKELFIITILFYGSIYLFTSFQDNIYSNYEFITSFVIYNFVGSMIFSALSYFIFLHKKQGVVIASALTTIFALLFMLIVALFYDEEVELYIHVDKPTSFSLDGTKIHLQQDTRIILGKKSFEIDAKHYQGHGVYVVNLEKDTHLKYIEIVSIPSSTQSTSMSEESSLTLQQNVSYKKVTRVDFNPRKAIIKTNSFREDSKKYGVIYVKFIPNEAPL